MDDEPPKLSLAASQSEAEKAAEWQMQDIRWATAEFMSNWLRVMRGAGKPHLMIRHLYELANAVKKAVDDGNVYKANCEIESVLQDAVPSYWNGRERDESYHTIVRGSLQLLASKLVGQGTQQIRGESEINDGIREMEDYWKKQREEVRASFTQRRGKNPLDRLHVQRKDGEALGRARPVVRIKPKAKTAKEPTSAPKPPKAIAPAPKTTAEFMRQRREGVLGED